jgi:hypothetical protein
MKKLFLFVFLIGIKFSVFSQIIVHAPGLGGSLHLDASVITSGKLDTSVLPTLYITISNLRTQTTTPQPGYIYTTDINQQGYWYYDPSDATSTDNTGTILVDVAGHRYKRIFSGLLNVLWFGAKGDGTTDNTAIITTATLAAYNNGLYFPGGNNFHISSLITTPLINTYWIGQDSTSIISGNFGYALINFLTTWNASISFLNIVNTYTNATQGSTGTIYWSHVDVVNFRINNVRITCPNANTDALSFQINIGDSTVTQHVMRDVWITHNKFEQVGRVCVDIFNRKFDSTGYTRFKNIHIDDNFSDSTGTQGSFGMLTSMDGASNGGCTVNGNYIKNSKSAGIEITDFNNTQVLGNTLEYTTRPYIPLEVDPAYPVYGLDIGGNRTIGALNTYCNFFNINQSTFHDNWLGGNLNTVANDAAVYLWAANNNTFTGEHYTGSTAALKVTSSTSGRYPGIPSSGNLFINCIFTGTPGISSRALMSFDSTGTSGNWIHQCSFLKGNDSSYVRQASGASGNVILDNLQDGVWGNYTPNPIYQNILSTGTTTLVAGTKALTITGLTSSSIPTVTVNSQNGASATVMYRAVCTTNTLTITALTSAGNNTTNTADISTLNYSVKF